MNTPNTTSIDESELISMVFPIESFVLIEQAAAILKMSVQEFFNLAINRKLDALVKEQTSNYSLSTQEIDITVYSPALAQMSNLSLGSE